MRIPDMVLISSQPVSACTIGTSGLAGHVEQANGLVLRFVPAANGLWSRQQLRGAPLLLEKGSSFRRKLYHAGLPCHDDDPVRSLLIDVFSFSRRDDVRSSKAFLGKFLLALMDGSVQANQDIVGIFFPINGD